MYTRKVVIQNPSGLHARPASELVNLASVFDSHITVKKLGDEKYPEGVNAKSIIMLLTLSLKRGTEVEIAASGPDEVQAVDSLANLLESMADTRNLKGGRSCD